MKQQTIADLLVFILFESFFIFGALVTYSRDPRLWWMAIFPIWFLIMTILDIRKRSKNTNH
jgi:hypothetical protein